MQLILPVAEGVWAAAQPALWYKVTPTSSKCCFCLGAVYRNLFHSPKKSRKSSFQIAGSILLAPHGHMQGWELTIITLTRHLGFSKFTAWRGFFPAPAVFPSFRLWNSRAFSSTVRATTIRQVLCHFLVTLNLSYLKKMTLNTLLTGNGKWIKIIQKKVSSSNIDYIWHQVSVLC